MMNKDKYIRQIALPQVGKEGQKKLTQASVLVIGAGGLGNGLLPYLAASGVGTIGIMDGDIVSTSNLHRQVLFSENDIDKLKVIVAKEKLNKQFPGVCINAYSEFLTGTNALKIFKNYDVIVDATDAIEARYLINDACILSNKPFVHAAVYRFQFQVATFNVNNSGTYRCLYPNPPETVQSCTEAGVMPSTVAMAALYQANEIFKYILGIGELLIDKMLLVDTLTNQQNKFSFKKKNQEFLTTDFFNKTYCEEERLLISFKEAKAEQGIFLDVRNKGEGPELSFSNYVQIPLNELKKNSKKLSKVLPIYIFCQSGKRSVLAHQILKEQAFTKVYCLTNNAPEILYEEKENSIYTR